MHIGMFVLSMIPLLFSVHTTKAQTNVFERAIRHFGGKVVNTAYYTESVTGFEQYLRASGVRLLTAEQMTRPHHPEVASALGYRNFLPRREWWPRGAALALLAEKIQRVTGEPLTLRNWWRPEAYNRDWRIEGAKKSDHLTAHSIDLDYPSAESRLRAERWLHTLSKEQRWLELSLGLGPRTTHIGIHSPHGGREWRYPAHATS